jgi:hypothetical protein
MAFIFTDAGDPRRREMVLKAGDKVKYDRMVMPAEVLSGPHKSPGHDRYLIRKADGNVTLASVSQLERIVPRVDLVAGTIAMNVYGRSFTSLTSSQKLAVTRLARTVLTIADTNRGE